MSKTYADALKYFRTKLKTGSEPVDPNLTTEVVGPQVNGLIRERVAEPPDVQSVSTTVAAPEPEVWEWSHLMSREEFLKRDPWRQNQLIAAWEENEYLSGKPFQPTLRGGIKNRDCFRDCPSYQCTCEENL